MNNIQCYKIFIHYTFACFVNTQFKLPIHVVQFCTVFLSCPFFIVIK